MKLEALVLRRLPFQEHSLIIHVLTKELGRISILAKGVYKAKNKAFVGYDTFSKSLFEVSKGKSFYYEREMVFLDRPNRIGLDFEVTLAAHLVSECILRTVEDEMPVEQLYEMTTVFSQSVGLSEAPMLLAAAWLLKFASMMGYRPILSDEDGEMFWTEEGVLKADSIGQVEILAPLNSEERRWMQLLLSGTFHDLQRQSAAPEMCRKQLFLAERYLCHHLEITHLRSLAVYDKEVR